jgi:putative phage-type endonuclease
MKCIVEKYDSRDAWLAGRHQSIGASEAAAVVGLSSYQSAYGLWVAKTEPIRIEPMEEIQRWGLLLEPAIRDEFNRVAPIKADTLPPNTIYRDRERPHLSCSFDAVGPDDEPVQLKTAHFAAAKVWAKEVPMAYMVQCQHEIHIAAAKCGYIAVLADGYQFAWHRVPRHQKFIDKLLKRLDNFWFEHVVKRVPPPTDYHAATSAALARQYPASNGKAIELAPELEPLVAEYDSLTKAESSAKKRKAEIANLLKQRLGDSEVGHFISGEAFKWKGGGGNRRFTRGKHKCA